MSNTSYWWGKLWPSLRIAVSWINSLPANVLLFPLSFKFLIVYRHMAWSMDYLFSSICLELIRVTCLCLRKSSEMRCVDVEKVYRKMLALKIAQSEGQQQTEIKILKRSLSADKYKWFVSRYSYFLWIFRKIFWVLFLFDLCFFCALGCSFRKTIYLLFEFCHNWYCYRNNITNNIAKFPMYFYMYLWWTF